jgi:hypothetical protein
MKPSFIDICAIILLSAMIIILSRDRRLDRAMCQNSLGTAKAEPAMNLSCPEAIFGLPSNPRNARPAGSPRVLAAVENAVKVEPVGAFELAPCPAARSAARAWCRSA